MKETVTVKPICIIITIGAAPSKRKKFSDRRLHSLSGNGIPGNPYFLFSCEDLASAVPNKVNSNLGIKRAGTRRKD
jgi:hypothetical protein